jgi:phospholipid/cholesterol/gamma-HCH transport system substrate-binding protein
VADSAIADDLLVMRYELTTMNGNIVNPIIGGIVLAIATAVLIFLYTRPNTDPVTGYAMTAKFDRVDGLKTGSDVRISGIKIGRVIDMEVDPATYNAIIRFIVDDPVRLPIDTRARIVSDGLVGDNYLEL